MLSAQTKTIGELLQQERESKQISRAELAQKIRVKEQFLEALEDNRFADLPAAVFVKGYIKGYARVLGFDSEPMLALLRRDFQEGDKGKLIPQDFLKPSFRKSAISPSISLATSGIIGVFLILFLYIGIRWYSFISPPKLELIEPTEDSLVSAQITIKGITEPETMVTVNSQPISVELDGNFETQITLPTEGISTITLEATDKQKKTTTLQRTVFVRF